MRQTFEAYCRTGEDREFTPLTCSPEALVQRARELLEASDAEEVEVHHMGSHLFTLTK